MEKKIFAAVFITLIFMFGCISPTPPPDDENITQNIPVVTVGAGASDFKFVRAHDEEDIASAITLSTSYYSRSDMSDMTETPGADIAYSAETTGAKSLPQDYSLTNVQVTGVDELDIVKIDSKTGQRLYVLNYDILNFIDAYPPEDLNNYLNVETKNEYYWSDSYGIYEYENVVVSISYEDIEAFDKETGDKVWSARLNSTYIDSRLTNGKLYLILLEYPESPYKPMPMEICKDKCVPVVLDYDDVYIPNMDNIEYFYDVLSIDILTGDIIDKKSFMGPYSSTVYMSKSNLYVAMYEVKSDDTVMFGYVLDEGKEILPNHTYNRLIYVDGLNISEQAKAVEFTVTLNNMYNSLTKEQKATLESDLRKGYSAYLRKYPEKKEYTGIVKIDYAADGTFEIKSTGTAPGELLNQFSMDEYDSYLRLAITYGDWDDSENGVIIFDDEMQEMSRITGLAQGERIYAVRFIGDKAYIVTYKEVDPLFVLDISDPSNPVLKGELKVPGYSTYLHPVGDDLLFGIGKDDWDVKVSLFDISNSSNPVELDSFITSEYWSEAVTNHHAFVYHPSRNLVILPIGSEDYIFNIENNKITLTKIIGQDAVRNVYIDEYLYVITNDRVIVYTLDDFNEVKRIDLEGSGHWYGGIVY